MKKRIWQSLNNKAEVYEEDQKLVICLETDPWTTVYRYFEVDEIRSLTKKLNNWLLKIDKNKKELPNPTSRTADYNERGD